MAERRIKLSDQARRAVRECGVSRYRLARITGIPESTLCRFVAGKAGMELANLDKLADVLGLEITIREDSKNKGR